MKDPLVSVIIVSYNTRDLTLKSAQSAFASRGFKKGEIEVIIIDNNSSDDTVQVVGSSFKQFRMIINDKNHGFGGANNQGVDMARGEYVLLLNSDAFLAKDTLRSLVDSLSVHKEFISVGPKFTYPDGSFQQSAGYFPTTWKVMGWMWGLDKLPLIKTLFPRPYHLYDEKSYQSSRPVDWLMAACVLIRKIDYAKAGGFDEQIFMYSEEVELFIRLANSTRKNSYLLANTSIIHLGNASTKKTGASRLVLELKGIEYIYAKHYPRLLWIIKLLLYTGVMLRIVIFSFTQSRRSAVLEYKKFFQTS